MLPTKGSEKEMTDTTETVAVHSYVDSEGDEIAVGSLVYVSEQTERGQYNQETYKWENARDFDFGVVSTLNQDGTVGVEWNAANCGCGGSDSGPRPEKGSDLTVTTVHAISLYYKGFDKGLDEGYKDARHDILGLFDLADVSQDRLNELEEKAFELEQLNK